jgi:glycosyltransferase involved in cell wall biosynthesis
MSKLLSLKIAILGTRGIPNNYGGFEQIAGYLSKGLIERGHTVTVYNSHNHPYKESTWNGVNIIHCYDPETRIGAAGQFIYDLNCILNARKKDFDIILMLGYTSSSIWHKLLPQKSTLIINMDGLEWKRSKYSKPVKKFLLYAEGLAIRSGDFFIADSTEIKKYLDGKYNIHTHYIPYGAETSQETDENIFNELRLVKHAYFLLVARIEPENNIEMVLDGFNKTASDKEFVVVGNVTNKFGRYLVKKYKADKRIRFIGSVYNKEKLKALTAFSYLYFHGHSVGGTNPSLLEAMAAGALIAAHDNVFNKAVLNVDAFFFDTDIAVQDIIRQTKRGMAEDKMISNNYLKIVNTFNWETVTGQYEQFFHECYTAKKSGK